MCSSDLGHHQGVAADFLVHLGRFVPGDDPRSDRSCGLEPCRQPGRPQGERHRRPLDPGRYRRRDAPLQGAGGGSRQADRRPARGAGRYGRCRSGGSGPGRSGERGLGKLRFFGSRNRPAPRLTPRGRSRFPGGGCVVRPRRSTLRDGRKLLKNRDSLVLTGYPLAHILRDRKSTRLNSSHT